jgi:hypothetical protein
MKKDNDVNVNWQTIFAFIPIISLWAYIRIEKFWLGFLLNFCLGFIPIVFMGIGAIFNDDVGLGTLFIGIGVAFWLKIHYMRKWSREWNVKEVSRNDNV